jgi:hypothetical protein
MRKLLLTLTAVLALGSSLLTTEAMARGGPGGGFHGGGFHGGGFHGGSFHTGGFHAGAFHTGGFAARGSSFAVHRGFAFRPHYALHTGYGFHRNYAFHRGFAFRHGARFGFIGYPRAWYGCYRWRQVLTPWGWRLHRVNVCHPYWYHHRYWYR